MSEPHDARTGPYWASSWDWTTPAAIFTAMMLGIVFAPEAGSRSFYEASAQVIPVIMLTLAIEARAFEWNLEWRGWRDRWDRGLDGPVVVAVSRVVVLLILITAELLALSRIAEPGGLATPAPKFVFAAIFAGFVAVVLAAVPQRSPPTAPRPHREAN